MLVLSRHVGERITARHRPTGEEIEIIVTRSSGPGCVRLGVTASAAWEIVRTELLDRDDMPPDDRETVRERIAEARAA